MVINLYQIQNSQSKAADIFTLQLSYFLGDGLGFAQSQMQIRPSLEQQVSQTF